MPSTDAPETTRTDATETTFTEPSGPDRPGVGAEDENGGVELARLAWLVTVLACLITIAILAVEGYYGYALVTLAVAVSAGINLT